ncbi:MAG: phosphoglycerate kinase [Pseudomonadota bacterium]
MTIKYIDELQIAERRLFIRVDFNVAMDEGGAISDDTRIRAALPTIRYALGQNARVILASHLGRPKGKLNPKYSMRPVGERLAELLGDVDVLHPEDCVGDAVKKLASELAPGQVMLLENLRFHPEEEANGDAFAKQLASLAEVYVNDAFGTAHRAHASTVGMVPYVAQKGAGFLMRAEVEALTRLLKNPARPFVALLGGAKVSDKLGVVENLMNICDRLLIGGGMAYTFLKAKGIAVGKSLVEEEKIHAARRILERAETRGIQIMLPLDHIVASVCSAEALPKETEGQAIPDEMMGLDIGPRTISKFTSAIEKAGTIFWNGPMGVFELAPFSVGTDRMAQAVADSAAVSVVGGGDSVAAVTKAGVADKINHISTGGGASLEFLEGKKLPGIAALEQ